MTVFRYVIEDGLSLSGLDHGSFRKRCLNVVVAMGP